MVSGVSGVSVVGIVVVVVSGVFGIVLGAWVVSDSAVCGSAAESESSELAQAENVRTASATIAVKRNLVFFRKLKDGFMGRKSGCGEGQVAEGVRVRRGSRLGRKVQGAGRVNLWRESRLGRKLKVQKAGLSNQIFDIAHTSRWLPLSLRLP